MEYSLKKYQVKKTKNYFKKNSFFFIFNFSKLKSKEWLKIEQKIKQLSLTHYKILNGITLKVLKKSINVNHLNIISGLVVFLKPKFKHTEFNIDELIKKLKPLFMLLSIKLNNKLYLISQISKMKTLSYKKSIFRLSRTIEKSTKTLFILKKQFEIM